MKNQVIVLAERPTGIPNENTFQFNTIEMPEILDGEVLLKTLYVSVDPGMRGFMKKGTDDDIGKRFRCSRSVCLFWNVKNWRN